MLSACSQQPLQKTAETQPEADAQERAEYRTPEPELTDETVEELARTPTDPVQPVAQDDDAPDDDLWKRVGANLNLPRHMEQRKVKGRLAWYARNQKYLDRVAGRASLYLHHIVGEVEKRGMPLELALLPIVESAFQPRARSHKAAVGIWQFIRGTGERYGLKQNCSYDGRRDIVAATGAALDYLEDLHTEFGDWLLAVAAYNTGERNVARAIRRNRRAGKDTGFFSLRLHRETRGYVPSLLAVAELVANPEQHGIVWQPVPDQQYFAQVDTGGQIDLAVAAELAALTRDELRDLNPGYEDWATRTQDGRRLLLPVASKETFLGKLSGLTPAQRLTAADVGEQCYYIVKRGDTLSHIAQRYRGVSARQLQAWNGISRPRSLKPGQKLKVFAAPAAQQVAVAVAKPVENPILYTVKRGDTLSQIGRRHGVSVKQLQTWNGISRPRDLRSGQTLRLWLRDAGNKVAAKAEQPASDPFHYTVRKNDSLWLIAKKFNVTVNQLLTWNNLRNDTIHPNQKITVYQSGSRSVGI
ncbi:MAG: LysM peptidoglycan-binding domain-containing protein [Gammaproteobacteria bacterium]|nr:LysM peptidoglycan-binding domain-containing protein [Gammaproteobacteria bacterium]